MSKHITMFLKVGILVLVLVAFGLSVGAMMDGTAYAMGFGGGETGHGRSGQHPRRTVSVSELATFALAGAGMIGGGIYFFTRKKKK